MVCGSPHSTNRGRSWETKETGRATYWPIHDNAITNIVWCVAADTQRIEAGAAKPKKPGGRQIGLYTILLSPILYGVWHTQGRSGGGRVLCDSCSSVGNAGGPNE